MCCVYVIVPEVSSIIHYFCRNGSKILRLRICFLRFLLFSFSCLRSKTRKVLYVNRQIYICEGVIFKNMFKYLHILLKRHFFSSLFIEQQQKKAIIRSSPFLNIAAYIRKGSKYIPQNCNPLRGAYLVWKKSFDIFFSVQNK